MDKHLRQNFDLRYLSIGIIVNAGVVQIGCGSSQVQRAVPVGYTTVGGKLVPLAGPPRFAVPLKAPVR